MTIMRAVSTSINGAVKVQDLYVARQHGHNGLIKGRQSTKCNRIFTHANLARKLAPIIRLRIVTLAIKPNRALIRHMNGYLGGFQVSHLVTINKERLRIITIAINSLNSDSQITLRAIHNVRNRSTNRNRQQGVR